MTKRGKGQSDRLGLQHERTGGPLGIFGDKAKEHDASIKNATNLIKDYLVQRYPKCEFRYRTTILKKEINEKLSSLDNKLGKVLFVERSNVKPDGGVLEAKDKCGNFRVLLISESKHQGNDVEKIAAGIKQGKYKNSDLMVAGNAVERVHKNILEFRNYMLAELHFPYVVFLQGSNFATNTFFVESPDGRRIKIAHDAGNMNRIDRVTPSSFGMEINKNYCKNVFIQLDGNIQMLQVASLYFQAAPWSLENMVQIMWEIVSTSFQVLSDALPISESASEGD